MKTYCPYFIIVPATNISCDRYHNIRIFLVLILLRCKSKSNSEAEQAIQIVPMETSVPMAQALCPEVTIATGLCSKRDAECS